MGSKRQKYFPLTARYFEIWTKKLQPEIHELEIRFHFQLADNKCQARNSIKPPAEYFSVHPEEMSPFHKTPKQVNKKQPKEVHLTLSLVRCEGTKKKKKTKGMTSTHTKISNCPGFRKRHKNPDYAY